MHITAVYRQRLKNAGVFLNYFYAFIATVLPAPTQRHDFLDEVNMPLTLTKRDLQKEKRHPNREAEAGQACPSYQCYAEIHCSTWPQTQPKLMQGLSAAHTTS